MTNRKNSPGFKGRRVVRPCPPHWSRIEDGRRAIACKIWRRTGFRLGNGGHILALRLVLLQNPVDPRHRDQHQTEHQERDHAQQSVQP